jgi:hypothetical protein
MEGEQGSKGSLPWTKKRKKNNHEKKEEEVSRYLNCQILVPEDCGTIISGYLLKVAGIRVV